MIPPRPRPVDPDAQFVGEIDPPRAARPSQLRRAIGAALFLLLIIAAAVPLLT